MPVLVFIPLNAYPIVSGLRPWWLCPCYISLPCNPLLVWSQLQWSNHKSHVFEQNDFQLEPKGAKGIFRFANILPEDTDRIFWHPGWIGIKQLPWHTEESACHHASLGWDLLAVLYASQVLGWFLSLYQHAENLWAKTAWLLSLDLALESPCAALALFLVVENLLEIDLGLALSSCLGYGWIDACWLDACCIWLSWSLLLP